MTPVVSLRLIGDNRSFQPGQALSGEYFVTVTDPLDIRAVEISVLWYTEGKGDEDMAVHFFNRATNDNGHFEDFRQSKSFETVLPPSPLSYDGAIVKIHWCVRARVFLTKGRELLTEQPFQLGSVPRPQPWPSEQSAADGDANDESIEVRQPTGGEIKAEN